MCKWGWVLGLQWFLAKSCANTHASANAANAIATFHRYGVCDG